MKLPTRDVLLGMTLGAVSAMVLATVGPGMVVQTFADGMLNAVMAPGFDTSKLVKFEGRRYQVQTEDWVSQDASSSQMVKKVEGGRVSYVTIATTPTGTYSSDGMFSRNVQYPGIAVDEAPHRTGSFSYWGGNRWFSFSSRAARSFLYLRSGDTRILTYGNTTCVSGKSFWVC